MYPILDLSFLRSFVAVAEKGSMTAAAEAVHVTQSALSLQIRKLEEAAGTALLERHARGVRVTPAGEVLLKHARRALSDNRDVLERIRTLSGHAAPLRLGASHDVLQPHVPDAIRRFNGEQPETRVEVVATWSHILKERLARGDVDMILTTEFTAPPGGRLLATRPIVWVSAPDSDIWKARPLPMTVVRGCQINEAVRAVLDRSGLPWTRAVEADGKRAAEVAVAAGRAVHAVLESARPPFLAPVPHQEALPDLMPVGIYLTCRETIAREAELLSVCLARSFAGGADGSTAF
jgi:DNA-binding transcriptional LysR family regulator